MTKDEYDALTEQEDKDGRFGDPKLKRLSAHTVWNLVRCTRS